jgi:hypothetical protein
VTRRPQQTKPDESENVTPLRSNSTLRSIVDSHDSRALA